MRPGGTLPYSDALYIIASRDSVDTFFYCAPYFNSDMGHYKGYTKRDFEDLLTALAKIKGKFLLSSYPSKSLSQYTEQYNWVNIQFEQMVTVNVKSGKEKKKTEVLM